MVLDTSALLAILLDEPESEAIRNAIEADKLHPTKFLAKNNSDNNLR